MLQEANREMQEGMDGRQTASGSGSSKASGSGLRSGVPATLKLQRELRYAREQEALSASLSRSAAGPSVRQLQVTALERAKADLESRIQERRQRVQILCDQLSKRNTLDEESCISLLHQRASEEHRLAAACKEQAELNNQIEQLKRKRGSKNSPPTYGSKPYCEQVSRANANLYMFLQKSATKRPFSMPSWPVSADPLRRYAVSRGYKSAPYDVQGRRQHNKSKKCLQPFVEVSQLNRYRHRNGPSRSGTSEPSSPRSMHSPGAPFSKGDQSVVLAVDEFRNSFSSRVILPPQPQPSRSSLRSLHASTTKRRTLSFAEQFKNKLNVGNLEYGNVTIIPRAKPRSKSDLLDNLTSVSLPTYVESLMSDFEQEFEPSLTLGVSERRVLETPTSPIPRKVVLLSTVQEEDSAHFPSVKGPPVIKPPGRKLSLAHRSIFTLRLPRRPSIHESASRSTLANSSSTSVSGSYDEQHSSTNHTETRSWSRPRGLPSTRNYDLSMLDRAPDEVREPSETNVDSFLPSIASPIRSRASRPLAALRDVKSKLVQLGRR